MTFAIPIRSSLPKAFFLTAFLLAASAMLSAQVPNILLNFNGTNGSTPFFMQFVQGRDGSLYGTTYNGGANNQGAVIRMNLATNSSVVLHSFNGPDGANPGAGVTLATDGNFYGTTVMGGSANVGVLYKINSAGTYTLLHQFAGGSDGSYPYGPPILGRDGSLYGATSGNLGVTATIYKLTSAGVYSVVYTFDSSSYGVFGVMQATDGLLYAATNIGGTSNCGTLVKLTTSGTLKATHSFNCSKGGAYPVTVPFQAADGHIYGTTQNGGTSGLGFGTFYGVSSTFGVSILFDFGTGFNIAEAPDSALMQATDGNIYGLTYASASGGSVIYDWTVSSFYTQVYGFGNPYFTGGLMQDTNGIFYGTSQLGGTQNEGYVYSFDTGLGPFIAFVRAQGRAGANAQILGQGLTGATSVTFNGVNATGFSVVSDTYMTAIVPAGAKTGPVVVTTPGGSLTSNVVFRVTQ